MTRLLVKWMSGPEPLPPGSPVGEVITKPRRPVRVSQIISFPSRRPARRRLFGQRQFKRLAVAEAVGARVEGPSQHPAVVALDAVFRVGPDLALRGAAGV